MNLHDYIDVGSFKSAIKDYGKNPPFDFLTKDYFYPKSHSHAQTGAHALSCKAVQYLFFGRTISPKPSLRILWWNLPLFEKKI